MDMDKAEGDVQAILRRANQRYVLRNSLTALDKPSFLAHILPGRNHLVV